MPPQAPDDQITLLLAQFSKGEKDAEEKLLALIYQELRRIARRHMRRENPGHTLQTTALVHEAYIRLFGKPIQWQNRSHFFSLASQVMRRILVDHARARKSAKRSGGRQVLIDEVALVSEGQVENVIAVDEALSRLGQKDARQAKLVELHIFGGLTLQEAADVLNISRRTAVRDWSFAQAWLYDQIRPSGPLSS